MPFSNSTTFSAYNNHTMDSTMDEDVPSQKENFLASSVMFLLSFSGLAAYISVIYVIVKHLSTKFRNSFYPFILSLAISDSLMLLLFFFYGAPLTITQEYNLGDFTDTYIVGPIVQIAFYSSLPCICVIGVNRYWAVCRFATYEQVFSRKNVRMMIGLIWGFGALVACHPFLPNFCTIKYYPSSYTWSYDMVLGWCSRFIFFERTLVGVTAFTLIISYTSIFVKKRQQNKVASKMIRNQQQMIERQKSEVRLAMNFLIVAIYLICFDVVFTTLPEFTFYRWYNFISSVMYIINCSINPYIYISFNRAIQSALKETAVGKFLGFKPVTNNSEAAGPGGGNSHRTPAWSFSRARGEIRMVSRQSAPNQSHVGHVGHH